MRVRSIATGEKLMTKPAEVTFTHRARHVVAAASFLDDGAAFALSDASAALAPSAHVKLQAVVSVVRHALIHVTTNTCNKR